MYSVVEKKRVHSAPLSCREEPAVCGRSTRSSFELFYLYSVRCFVCKILKGFYSNNSLTVKKIRSRNTQEKIKDRKSGLKGASCSFGEEDKDLHWFFFFFDDTTNYSQTNCLCFHGWINWINTISRFFALFTCGGPCRLARFKHSSGDLCFPLRTACLFSYGKSKHVCVCLITSFI